MSALNQLMDMGIPKSRAQAALERTKGDVMSAAERIFGGDFDDIASDDGGESSHTDPTASPAEGSGSRVEDEQEDYNQEHESLGEVEDYEQDEIGEINTLADPYANVFFSKDRTERIIEPIPEKEVTDERHIMSRAEWMRGCPEGNEQSFLFQHYTYLESGDLPCPAGCGKNYTRDRADFFAFLPTFASYEKHLEGIVSRICPGCGQVMCLACGEKIRDVVGSGKFSGDVRPTSNNQKLLHCPNLQGVIIGMGLYMIEKTFCQAKPPITDTIISVSLPLKRMRHPSEESSEEFTPTGPRTGTGYAGNGNEDTSGQKAAIAAQAKIDKATTQILKQIQVYLPNLDRPGGPCISDHMVHPTALAHLRRKCTFVNDLLRNESLLDMTSREKLYAVMLDWLKLISNHESLASMLAMPQMRPTKFEVDEKDPNFWTVTYEGASSPRELLENCAIQAKAALKSLSEIHKSIEGECSDEQKEARRLEAAYRTKEEQEAAMKAEAEWQETSVEDDKLKAFCQRIVDAAVSIDKSLAEVKGRSFVEKMKDSLPKIPDMGDHVIQTKQTSTNPEAVKKIYEEWATKTRFQYCDMSKDNGGYKHCYDDRLRGTIGAVSDSMLRRRYEAHEKGHRGRVRAIAQEMGMLSTSLPVSWDSSIFVRVDSSRPDCLKAMIIGPHGTPYENGCFIFDIYLPGDYNNIAPLISSMTTNGGKYRYNPNLYADGKVCLSLLGTWSGPGWIPGKSTLLQVLISIQSLILCDEPYLNEPGWAGSGGSKESKSYSANVRRMVIRDAMANNLETPPFPFEYEIKTHFMLKKHQIIGQLEEWKVIDNGHDVVDSQHFSGRSCATPPIDGSRTPYDVGADRLRTLLDALDIE